jgi:hypothetical protein
MRIIVQLVYVQGKASRVPSGPSLVPLGAFAGWYMVNVLGLPSEDVAIARVVRASMCNTTILMGHADSRA